VSKPRFEPGELVVARIRHPSRPDGGDEGKFRPGVLIDRLFNHEWRVMGLTTNSAYENGEPRLVVPQQANETIGPGKSWLWGPNPPSIRPQDIVEHIGWANNDLIDLIAKLMHLTNWDVEPMRPHNRRRRSR
jgi:hypothetical protein